MMFNTLRVLLSTDRKKQIVASDLIAKGRPLTMLLDRKVRASVKVEAFEEIMADMVR
jgi:hypothetical protein